MGTPVILGGWNLKIDSKQLVATPSSIKQSSLNVPA